MAEQGNKQEKTLHDQLTEAYDSTVGAPATPESTAEAPATTQPSTEVATESAPVVSERQRDPVTGQFLPADKAKPKEASTAQPLGRDPTPKPGVVAAPVDEKLGVKRPDSWKKELWPVWDKLDAGLPLTKDERKAYLEYQLEREGQYTKGVSAYKAEAEHAKRLIEAITPYQQMMQSQGIAPEKFISTLASTHQTLSSGSPQEKLRAFARFAQDYQIPLHELLIQGEDGKVYLNQQYFQAPQQEAPGTIRPQDIDRAVDAKVQQYMLQRLVQEFVASKDASGNPLHPHFDEVRQTMDGLLRQGLAKDLQGAYDAALRLPQHASTFEAISEQKRKLEEEAKAKEEAEKAARARANAVSPKTATPTGSIPGAGKKGLRSVLEDSYDQHVTGRI